MKTALITGASRGIGKAIHTLFTANGFRTITPTRSELDLGSNASINQFLQQLSMPVDILINNAGINDLGSCTEFDDNVAENMLQTDLMAPMKLIKGIAPGMIERRYGRIINTSSVWSQVSKPGRMIYSAAKTGLNGMIRTVALELAPYNILVNNIAPGFVNTELTQQNNNAKQIHQLETQIPLGRLAEPQEIAELVLFLSSEKNTYITGQTILIDGGYTCR